MKDKRLISSVGVIGCGWLGTPLAKALLAQNIDVLATRSRIENIAELTVQGIDAEVLLLPATTPSCVEKLNQHSVFKQHNLVIAITPQFRKGLENYSEKVAQLVQAAQERGNVNSIVLLSSSAVYNGLVDEVNEESLLDFSADKVTILHEAEKAVLNFADESEQRTSYVLRLAGLVGSDRHPGNFLQHGRMLKSPEAKVNLIHQQDALGLIISLLTTKPCSGVYNGVSDTHVSKKTYYQKAARALSLPEPIFFENENVVISRTVSGRKAQQVLSYQFVYPDLLTWL